MPAVEHAAYQPGAVDQPWRTSTVRVESRRGLTILEAILEDELRPRTREPRTREPRAREPANREPPNYSE
jgi:hypothetical protein